MFYSFKNRNFKNNADFAKQILPKNVKIQIVILIMVLGFKRCT